MIIEINKISCFEIKYKTKDIIHLKIIISLITFGSYFKCLNKLKVMNSFQF